MKRWIGVILGAGALLAGCAGTGGGRPEWVDGPPSAYPDATHVTGTASGSTADAARANARAALSRVFLSRVESEVRDETSSEIRDSREVSAVERLSIETRVSTEGSFEGVKIAETWQSRDGTWHALAVLDKASMRRTLQARIDEATRRMRGHLDRSAAAPTALGRSKFLIESLRAGRARDALVARGRVVGRRPDDHRPTTAAVESDLESSLAGTRFEVRAVEVDAATDAEIGTLPKLRERLEERLTSMGFQTVAPGRSDANVWLTCRMSLEELDRGFKGHFFRWQGAWEVTGEPPHGSVVLASQDSGGESHTTKSVARSRALAKGAQKLATDLEAQISRYLREPAEH